MSLYSAKASGNRPLTLNNRHHRFQRPPLSPNDRLLCLILSAHPLPAYRKTARPTYRVRSFQNGQSRWHCDQHHLCGLYLIHPLLRCLANNNAGVVYEYELCRTDRIGSDTLRIGRLGDWRKEEICAASDTNGQMRLRCVAKLDMRAVELDREIAKPGHRCFFQSTFLSKKTELHASAMSIVSSWWSKVRATTRLRHCSNDKLAHLTQVFPSRYSKQIRLSLRVVNF